MVEIFFLLLMKLIITIIARFEKDRELTEAEILDKAYSRITKRYVISKTIDNTLHGNVIKRISFSNIDDALIVLEQGAKKVKIYNLDTTIRYILEPSVEDKAFIIDACYSEVTNMVKIYKTIK